MTHIKKLRQSVNCAPKVRQEKSNFWGAIFMKLSYEDKVQIYHLRKSGTSLKPLSKQFDINQSEAEYLI